VNKYNVKNPIHNLTKNRSKNLWKTLGEHVG